MDHCCEHAAPARDECRSAYGRVDPRTQHIPGVPDPQKQIQRSGSTWTLFNNNAPFEYFLAILQCYHDCEERSHPFAYSYKLVNKSIDEVKNTAWLIRMQL